MALSEETGSRKTVPPRYERIEGISNELSEMHSADSTQGASRSSTETIKDGRSKVKPSPITAEAATISPAESEPLRPGSIHKSKLSGYLNNSWNLSFLSWTVSLSAMITMAALLYTYDGSPLPNWKYGITLNVYVSILATVVKSAMLSPVSESISQLKWTSFGRRARMTSFQVLDSASKGPLGSVNLLLRIMTVSPLAVVGAFLVLVSLTLDPFFQQIIGYEPIDVTDHDGTARIPVALGYDPQWDYYMEGATTNYQLTQNTSIAVNATCSTSKCTWGSYASLAYCSACNDISNSDHIQTSCTTTYCNHTIRGSQEWVGVASSYNQSYSMGSSYDWSLTNSTPPPFFTYNTSSPNISSPEMSLYFHTIGTPGGDDGIFRNRTPVAFECGVWLCVQTYTSSIINGSFSERPVTSHSDFNITKDKSGKPATFLMNPGGGHTTFWATPSAVNLSNFLTGFTSSNAESQAEVCQTYWDDEYQEYYEVCPESDQLKKDIKDALRDRFSAANFNPTSFVTGLTDAMTAVIRQQTNGNSTFSPGTVHVTKTYVKVRWLYIIPPLVLLFGSLGLLIGVVMRSKRSKAVAWKSSALAPLLHRARFSDEKPSDEGELTVHDIIDIAEHLDLIIKNDEALIELREAARLSGPDRMRWWKRSLRSRRNGTS